MNNLPFILNEHEISKWAYFYCFKINHDPEIKEYITTPRWAYWYCLTFDNNDKRLFKLGKVFLNI